MTWHCVFGSPFAQREPPEGWSSDSPLPYEVIPLVPDELVYEPTTIVIYQGSCSVDAAEVAEGATTYVNFTTSGAGCLVGTGPLMAFPYGPAEVAQKGEMSPRVR